MNEVITDLPGDWDSQIGAPPADRRTNRHIPVEVLGQDEAISRGRWQVCSMVRITGIALVKVAHRQARPVEATG